MSRARWRLEKVLIKFKPTGCREKMSPMEDQSRLSKRLGRLIKEKNNLRLRLKMNLWFKEYQNGSDYPNGIWVWMLLALIWMLYVFVGHATNGKYIGDVMNLLYSLEFFFFFGVCVCVCGEGEWIYVVDWYKFWTLDFSWSSLLLCILLFHNTMMMRIRQRIFYNLERMI
jgi:hypothetical protein